MQKPKVEPASARIVAEINDIQQVQNRKENMSQQNQERGIFFNFVINFQHLRKRFAFAPCGIFIPLGTNL